MKKTGVLLSLLLLPAPLCLAAEGPLRDSWDRINYSLGHQIGSDFKRLGMTVDPEILAEGIRDAHAGKDPRIDAQQMQLVLAQVKQKIVADKREEIAARPAAKQELVEKYRGEGRDFLAANAKQAGVVTLKSGLQYKVEQEGSGTPPGPQDSVTVRYRGTLIDGTEFSSSPAGGAGEKYRVDAVIPAWTEALQLMKPGARWRLFAPADLAFGERGPLADRAVIFDMELVAVEPGNN